MSVDYPDWSAATIVASSNIFKVKLPYQQNPSAAVNVTLDAGSTAVAWDTLAPLPNDVGAGNVTLNIVGVTSGTVYLNQLFNVGNTRLQGSALLDSRDSAVAVNFHGAPALVDAASVQIGEIIPALSVIGLGGTYDVSDRVGRLLGIIASITAPVDVSDRAARLLGTVSPVAASVWDVSDRAARLVGRVVVDSITAAVDVSDRAGRLLGTVSAVAGSVWDVSDRAARLLGHVTVDNASLTVQEGASPPSWQSPNKRSLGVGVVAGANQVVVAGVASQTIRIWEISGGMDVAVAAAAVTFQDGNAGAVVAELPTVTVNPQTQSLFGAPLTLANGLFITVPVGTAFRGTIVYSQST